MSQQTTLGVVIPKYLEFLKQLPTVYDLAACDQEKLRQLWSGLGYYARARNLNKGAQFIVEQLEGRFPQTYREWLEIPGCGPYTAAVIASICYNEKVACVDGNVVRVVSRLLALSEDVWNSSGKSAVQAYISSTIPAQRPGDFNQAMMDLGATVCRKTKPLCHLCPLQKHCLAFTENCIDICPPKKPRRDSVAVDLLALILWEETTDTLALVERAEGFLLETVGFPLISKIQASEVKKILKPLYKLQVAEPPSRFLHVITHHRISGSILIVRSGENLNIAIANVLNHELGFSQPLCWIKRSMLAASLSTSLDNKVFKLFQDCVKENSTLL